jgi:ankyrin repeat protein
MNEISRIKILLYHILNPNSNNNNNNIMKAYENGHIDIVNRLLEYSNVDPSANNNFLIRKASKEGHINIVNRLLKDTRVDPTENYNEAIRLASVYGHIEVVNRLLEEPKIFNDIYIQYNDDNNCRKKIQEVLKIRKKIFDQSEIPDDLMYEISKYLYYDNKYHHHHTETSLEPVFCMRNYFISTSSF